MELFSKRIVSAMIESWLPLMALPGFPASFLHHVPHQLIKDTASLNILEALHHLLRYSEGPTDALIPLVAGRRHQKAGPDGGIRNVAPRRPERSAEICRVPNPTRVRERKFPYPQLPRDGGLAWGR